MDRVFEEVMAATQQRYINPGTWDFLCSLLTIECALKWGEAKEDCEELRAWVWSHRCARAQEILIDALFEAMRQFPTSCCTPYEAYDWWRNHRYVIVKCQNCDCSIGRTFTYETWKGIGRRPLSP
jgi:hypothetical protein